MNRGGFKNKYKGLLPTKTDINVIENVDSVELAGEARMFVSGIQPSDPKLQKYSSYPAVGSTRAGDSVYTALAWTTASTYSYSLERLAYANGLLVALSYGGAFAYIIVSTDGANWATRISAMTSTMNTIAYGNGLWVVAGYGGQLQTSTDTVTWVSRNAIVPSTALIQEVAYGGGNWCFVAQSHGVYSSTDGITWTTSKFDNTGTSRIGYGNGLWVRNTNGSKAIQTSTDTVNWVTGPFNNGNNQISFFAYRNNIWFTHSYTTLFTSTDAITWVTSISGSTFTGGFSSVEFANNIFLTGGGANTPLGFGNNLAAPMFTSTDAVTWVTNALILAPRYFVYGPNGWIGTKSYAILSSKPSLYPEIGGIVVDGGSPGSSTTTWF